MHTDCLTRRLIPEIPGVKRRYRNIHPVLHIFNVNSAHVKRFIADNLGRCKAVQFIEKLSLVVHFRHKEISCCHIGRCNSIFVRKIDDTHQIIVLRLIERLHVNIGSWCHYTDDLTLDNAFCQFRILHLFTDGNLVAFLNEAVDIAIRRMKRHTTHRCTLLESTAFTG